METKKYQLVEEMVEAIESPMLEDVGSSVISNLAVTGSVVPDVAGSSSDLPVVEEVGLYKSPRKVNKTWEAILKYQGTIYADPDFLRGV